MLFSPLHPLSAPLRPPLKVKQEFAAKEKAQKASAKTLEKATKKAAVA